MTNREENIALDPKSPLSPLEWAVYHFISDNAPKIRTQADVCDYVNSKGFTLELTEAPNKNGKGQRCRTLTRIIERINSTDPSYHLKVISTKDYTYAVATPEATLKIVDGNIKIALMKLKRNYIVKRKLESEGQGQLLNAALNPMGEKNAEHEFYEACFRKLEKEEGK